MAYGRFDVPKDFITLTPDQVAEYSADAQKHYRSDYPYHNWNHALDVASGTEIISDKLRTHGLTIASGALAVAAAWHDAGYHEDHTAKGFETKEQYSAYLLDEYLEGKSVSDTERLLMRNAIIATWAKHPELRTPYELIMHRADIANIGGPSDEFILNSIHLWEEYRMTGDASLSWEEYVKGAGGFIMFTATEHDHESLKHFIDPADNTVDVNDLPFSTTALSNLEILRTTEQ